MAQILIAGKDWTARALLRAQLIEEGFDVGAFETVDDAIKRLWASRAMPALLIADLLESENWEDDIAKLSAWVKLLPVWIMATHGAGGAGAATLQGHGFERILFRPLDLGRLVLEIKERLAG